MKDLPKVFHNNVNKRFKSQMDYDIIGLLNHNK
jgi:hypothetical protein